MKRFFTITALCLACIVCSSQNNEVRKALLKSGDTVTVVLDTCISPTSIYHTPEGVKVPDNTIHHFLLKPGNQKTKPSENNQDSHYYVNSSKGNRDSYYYVSTPQGDKMYHNGKLVYESHITEIGDNLYIESHYYE